jgi:hypothetical protein
MTMKTFKKLSLIALVFPLALTSCKTAAQNAVALPSQGTVITAEEGKKQLASSFTAEAASDAIGFSISNASLSGSASLSVSLGSQSISSMNGSFSLGTTDISAGISGLTGTTVAGLKASARASSVIKASYTENSAVSSTTTTFANGSYSAACYIQDGNFYADLSNENVQKLVSTLVASLSSLTNVTSLPEKVMSPLSLKDSDFPLVNATKAQEAYDDFNKTLENLSLDTEGTYRSHGKDTYSYSLSMTGKTLTEMVNAAKTSSSTATSASASSAISGGMTLPFDMGSIGLTFSDNSYYDFTLVYDVNGLVSLGFGIDLSVSYTYAQTLSSDMTALLTSTSTSTPLSYVYSGNGKLQAAIKINVLSGSNVVIDELKDTSAYQTVSD